MKARLFLIALLSLSFLGSCSDDSDTPTAKNVTYEVVFDQTEGNSALILKGEYIDKMGVTVLIDQELPFKVELKDVSLDIPTGFKGYIYAGKAIKLIGRMTMIVRSVPGNKMTVRHNKEVDLLSDSPFGFSGEELKTETSFDFKE